VKHFAQISPLTPHKFDAGQQDQQALLETTFVVNEEIEGWQQVSALHFWVNPVA
jgi:hypothetical protein